MYYVTKEVVGVFVRFRAPLHPHSLKETMICCPDAATGLIRAVHAAILRRELGIL
jgi:hypothetical protein